MSSSATARWERCCSRQDSTTGGAPEAWNVERPDIVKGIYQGYASAGSQVISTNTFGGTSYRLGRENLQDHVRVYNLAGARLAR